VPDLDALTRRATYAAYVADGAEQSLAGLEQHVAGLRAALKTGEAALAASRERAEAARAAADKAASRLADVPAHLPTADRSVSAQVGTATGRAVK
jgi:septal ring factor EnvC (AmiA/AmiB activator)